MKIQRTKYYSWAGHPTYFVRERDEFQEICKWMCQNNVEYFMLSSGSTGYKFHVTANKEWFALRWE